MTTSPVMGITEEILSEIERAGWKLVPMESTVVMEDSGCKAAARLMGMSDAGTVYRAMLDAAPTPPKRARAMSDEIRQALFSLADRIEEANGEPISIAIAAAPALRTALAQQPAPPAPVAQEPVACGGCGAADEAQRCIGCMHPFTAPPAAERPSHSAVAADMVRCACGDGYPALSYGAGFISGSGMCENCDAALPAKDMAAEHPDTVTVPRELLAEAESIIDSYAEALKARHAPGGDWDGEEAALDDYEREAGVAAKLRRLLAGGAE